MSTAAKSPRYAVSEPNALTLILLRAKGIACDVEFALEHIDADANRANDVRYRLLSDFADALDEFIRGMKAT